MIQKSQKHLLFLGIPSRGHVAPTLGLVKSLIEYGYNVSYCNTKAFKDLIESSGANFIEYESRTMDTMQIPITELEPHQVTIELQKLFFVITTEILPQLSKLQDQTKFSAVFYDQMALWGQIFADRYGVLSFCSNTMFLFSTEDIIMQIPKFQAALDEDYSQKLALITQLDTSISSFYDILKIQIAAKADYIITYYSSELMPTPQSFASNKIIYLSNRFNKFDLPISKAAFTPESLVYISLGTVFNDKLDLFTLFIETFKHTNQQVIISTGGNESMYKTLVRNNSSQNIEIRKFVNQLELLNKAALFITHAGFNSIYEGLYFSVPMLMIPHNPEQYFNAQRVQELKAGYLLEDHQLYPKSVAESINKMQSNYAEYKLACLRIRESFIKGQGNNEVAGKIDKLL